MADPNTFGIAGLSAWPVAHSRSPVIHNHWLAALRHCRGGTCCSRCRPSGSRLRCAGSPRWACAAAMSPRRTSRRYAADRPRRRLARRSAPSTPSSSNRTGRSADSTTTAMASCRACATRIRSGRPTAGPFSCWARAVQRAPSSRASRRRAQREIRVANRTRDKAEAIAAASRPGRQSVAVGRTREDALDGVALLANATSLGMTGKPPLDIALDRLPRKALVGDLIYTPPETPLLARRACAATSPSTGSACCSTRRGPHSMHGLA